PVPEQARFDVLTLQRLAQERVVLEVDLAHGEVVRGPPPGVERLELGGARGGGGGGRPAGGRGHGAFPDRVPHGISRGSTPSPYDRRAAGEGPEVPLRAVRSVRMSRG